jgi:hypothetical protein
LCIALLSGLIAPKIAVRAGDSRCAQEEQIQLKLPRDLSGCGTFPVVVGACSGGVSAAAFGSHPRLLGNYFLVNGGAGMSAVAEKIINHVQTFEFWFDVLFMGIVVAIISGWIRDRLPTLRMTHRWADAVNYMHVFVAMGLALANAAR